MAKMSKKARETFERKKLEPKPPKSWIEDADFGWLDKPDTKEDLVKRIHFYEREIVRAKEQLRILEISDGMGWINDD
jgi:hypothetical protein